MCATEIVPFVCSPGGSLQMDDRLVTDLLESSGWISSSRNRNWCFFFFSPWFLKKPNPWIQSRNLWYFKPLPPLLILSSGLRANMFLPKRKKVQTFALLFCILTFTTLLFSYTFRDPSLYFIKYALRQSDYFFSKGPCACRRSCVAELDDGDPWFSERFNQTVHPLMTRENSALSDETFKWWQVRLCLFFNKAGWNPRDRRWVQVTEADSYARSSGSTSTKASFFFFSPSYCIWMYRRRSEKLFLSLSTTPITSPSHFTQRLLRAQRALLSGRGALLN